MGLFGRKSAAKKAEEERLARAEAERKAKEEAERKARESQSAAAKKPFKATVLVRKHFEEIGLKNVRTDVTNDFSVVIVGFSAEKAPGRDFFFFSSDNDNDVKVRCEPIASIPPEKKLQALRIINNYTSDKAFAGLSIDENNRLRIGFDIPIESSDATVGPIAYEFMVRSVNIIDDIYPDIMKLIWS